MGLQERTATAIDRIKAAFWVNDGDVISGHSGGKDSVVIDDLIRRSNYEPAYIVHNVKPLLGTSGDPVAALTEMHPLTLEFLYTDVCMKRTITFMHSSRMSDWLLCVNVKCQIDGSRLCEFSRSGKSSQFIMNGVSTSRSEMTEYVKNGIFGLNMSYPIYDWSDDDVFEYIHENGLNISKEYDVNGEYDDWKRRNNISAPCR